MSTEMFLSDKELVKKRLIISLEGLQGGDFTKKFAADSHIHSFTHAFGDPEERNGLWCLKNPVEAQFVMEGINGTLKNSSRYFLKIVAMLQRWREYLCPIEVEVNGHKIWAGKLFFENVARGWPANYLPFPAEVFLRGENIVRIRNKSENNYLILNRLEVIERALFPAIFSQEKKRGTLRVEQMKDAAGESSIYVGGDTDDIRLDEESGEAEHFLDLLKETGVGNFIVFRPNYGRNFVVPASPSTWKKRIEYCEKNGIYFRITCWPLPGEPFSLEYLKEKKFFQGVHVHESYLIFQTAQNPKFYQERRAPDIDQFMAAKDAKETEKAYREYLKEAVKKYRELDLPVAFGEPSLLAPYLPIEPGDSIQAEPVTNVSLLFGAVRATSKWKNIRWGVHIAIDWYLGFPHDRNASRRFKLLANLAYISGANWVYAENSLLKTNAYERFDEEDEFPTRNRTILRNFYRYVQLHPRNGELKVNLGVIYGNLESMLWYPDDRIPELEDTNDWDLRFWGKWKEIDHFRCWRALDGWLPPLPLGKFKDNPSILKLFTGTPFGPVDIVPSEADGEFFKKYKCLVFLGWNTMTPALYQKLIDYVSGGGTLYLSGCHLDTRILPSGEIQIINNGRVRDLIGAEIKGKGKRISDFQFGGNNYRISKVVSYTFDIKTSSAQVLLKDFLGTPVILANSLGKGKVYFGNFAGFPHQEELVKFNQNFLRYLAGKTVSRIVECKNEAAITYALWEEDRQQRICLTNVDWKKEGNEKRCLLALWKKKFLLVVKEGEIREVVHNKEIGLSPLKENIHVLKIRKMASKKHEVEVVGEGNTKAELFLNEGRLQEIILGEEKVKFTENKGKYLFSIETKGKEFIRIMVG